MTMMMLMMLHDGGDDYYGNDDDDDGHFAIRAPSARGSEAINHVYSDQIFSEQLAQQKCSKNSPKICNV